jgi:predicted DNA-binding transcriptional regulator AlpA
MEARELEKAIATMTPAELTAILGLAFCRLVALAGVQNVTARRPPRLVRIEEAALSVGMSRRWFYDHQNEPFIRRVGRAVRVDLPALEAWLEQRRGG